MYIFVLSMNMDQPEGQTYNLINCIIALVCGMWENMFGSLHYLETVSIDNLVDDETSDLCRHYYFKL